MVDRTAAIPVIDAASVPLQQGQWGGGERWVGIDARQRLLNPLRQSRERRS